MRRLAVGLVLLTALLALGLLGTRSLETTAEQIGPLLEAAREASSAGHAPEAEGLAAEALTIWQQRRSRMASITDHRVMEEIDCAFGALTASGAAREPGDFDRTCRELQVRIRSLWESERLKISNLLCAWGRRCPGGRHGFLRI